jgi:hypothetical protein
MNPTTPDTGAQLLFDIRLVSPPNTGFLAASAIGLVVALGLWLWRRHQGKNSVLPRFFVAAMTVMLAVTTLSVWDHHRMQAALQGGQTRVAEGALQSYSVQHRAAYNPSSKRYDRSVAESFYVGAVAFGFVRDTSAAGYTNSGTEPLVFVPGEALRVHYIEDKPGDFASRRIVRLERLPAAGPAPAAVLPAVDR